MRLGDFIKNVLEEEEEASRKAGSAGARQIALTDANLCRIGKRYIAFDVETTGLSAQNDRIIELGAVVFENGNAAETFSTLVNPRIPVPRAASEVNHITNAMLARAPGEAAVYAQFVEFLDDALQGGTVLCAHNAKFDMGFLCNTLSRLGYDAQIEYVDTLGIARQRLRGLPNYRQQTLEAHYGLNNRAAHRALSDAENCGHILRNLLNLQ